MRATTGTMNDMVLLLVLAVCVVVIVVARTRRGSQAAKLRNSAVQVGLSDPDPTLHASGPRPRALTDVVDLPSLMDNVNGSKEVLRELVTLLRNSLPERLDCIHRAIAAGDAEVLYREAHSLKGAIGGLRARRAYDVVCCLEKQARIGDIVGSKGFELELRDSLEELAARLLEECDKAQDA